MCVDRPVCIDKHDDDTCGAGVASASLKSICNVCTPSQKSDCESCDSDLNSCIETKLSEVHSAGVDCSDDCNSSSIHADDVDSYGEDFVKSKCSYGVCNVCHVPFGSICEVNSVNTCEVDSPRRGKRVPRGS